MFKHLKIIAAVLSAALAAGPVFAQATLEIGAAMPMKDKALPAVSGQQNSIASVKGAKGTLVMFWCNTCPWVTRYEDRMVDLAATYKDQGIGIIAINPNDAVAYPGDSIGEMKKQSDERGYTFPYVSDPGSQVANAFGAKRTPQAFLFNAADALVYQGAFDDSPSDGDKVEAAYLTDALDALVAGGQIAMAETKAFGCTIKFQ